MLMIAIGLVSLYLLVKLYVSVMQIGYINQTKRKDAVLMLPGDFLKAGNYSVAKEKLAMVSALIEYLLFIVWISGGIAWLENSTLVQDEALKSIVMVLGFVLISGAVTLPLDLYSKFVLDEKFGFNRSSVGLFIKDTAITAVLSIVLGGLVVWGIYVIMSSFDLWWFWSFVFIFGVHDSNLH